MINTRNQAAVRLSNPSTLRRCARATWHNWGTVNRHIHQFTHRGEPRVRGALTAALQPGLPNACASQVRTQARSGWRTTPARRRRLPLSWPNAACLPCRTHSAATPAHTAYCCSERQCENEQHRQSQLLQVPPAWPRRGTLHASPCARGVNSAENSHLPEGLVLGHTAQPGCNLYLAPGREQLCYCGKEQLSGGGHTAI